MQFLHHNWRKERDIADLRQEVYARVCEAARKQIPEPTKPFVFAIARNLLIDRVRREQIVPIDAVSDLDALAIAADVPGPERTAIARDELRRLQAALDNLPPRCREIVVLARIEGFSGREIAGRMGISRFRRVAAAGQWHARARRCALRRERRKLMSDVARACTSKPKRPHGCAAACMVSGARPIRPRSMPGFRNPITIASPIGGWKRHGTGRSALSALQPTANEPNCGRDCAALICKIAAVFVVAAVLGVVGSRVSPPAA